MSFEDFGAAGSMTIGCAWTPSHTIQVPAGIRLGEHRPMVYGFGRRLCGIDWWAERTRFEAVVTGWSSETGEAEFSVVSPVLEERAEWWRRWGYAIVSRLP